MFQISTLAGVVPNPAYYYPLDLSTEIHNIHQTHGSIVTGKVRHLTKNVRLSYTEDDIKHA